MFRNIKNIRYVILFNAIGDRQLFNRLSFITRNKLLIRNNQTMSFEPIGSAVDLKAVAGYAEIKRLLSPVIEYLQAPLPYIARYRSRPQDMLIYGPPGTGKTFMTHAIAGHAGVPLLSLSASELLGKYIGETEERLSELFKQADKHEPCIILMDELDGLASTRLQNPSHSAGVSHNITVNLLLSLLTDKHPRVYVIGTTNHRHTVDPAVLRDGRLGLHVLLDIPNAVDRREILSHCMQRCEMSLTDPLQMDDLVRISDTFTAAKIANWVSTATTLAKRHQRELDMYVFEAVLPMILGQMASTSVIFSDQEMHQAAIYKAGHAIVGLQLAYKLHKISIEGDLPVTQWQKHLLGRGSTKQQLLNSICVTLAGLAASRLAHVEHTGARSDIQAAMLTAQQIIDNGLGATLTPLNRSSQIELMLQEQMQRAEDILKSNQRQHEYLVAALLEHKQLLGEDISSILLGQKISEKSKHYLNTSTLFSNLITHQLPKSELSKVTFECKRGDVLVDQIIFLSNKENIANGLMLQESSILSVEFIKHGLQIKFSEEVRIDFESVVEEKSLSKIQSYLDDHSLTARYLPQGVLIIPEENFAKFIEICKEKSAATLCIKF